jgi:hypothetical protein
VSAVVHLMIHMASDLGPLILQTIPRSQFRSIFGNPNANLTSPREKCSKCTTGLFCYVSSSFVPI